MKKQVDGIRINYSSTQREIRAGFFVEKGVISENFISNPAIRKTIKENKNLFKEKMQIGRMSLEINRTKKSALWEAYYPFYFPEPTKKIGVGKYREAFTGKGIASLLELKVLKEMKKRFSKINIIFHPMPAGPRMRQLENRGLQEKNSGFSYTYNKSIKKLTRTIALHRSISMKKKRIIRKIKKLNPKKLFSRRKKVI